jgi:eukaryotic-like serine/threonine-protein kinase
LADDYFSDGLSDELAHALVRIPGLRVSGRTSANAFRARNATATEIGRALRVEAIVEGNVRRAGGRLRVAAQLISTANGHVLWASEPFESRSADVFQVQDEFTRAVVTALAPTLRGESATSIATSSRGTRDAEAYDLYLQGRYFWSRRGIANLKRALDYFRRSTLEDPGFARAHAGLALAYVVMPAFDVNMPPDSMMQLARASAERALALQPAIADAHLAMANVHTRYLRLDDARRHFHAALADAPLDPTAHAWYADHLKYMGKLDSALLEKRRAVELEPLSALLTNQLAQTLFEAHQLPEAVTVAHRIAELDSTFTRGYLTLARIQILRGFPDSAIAALETAERLGPPLGGERGLRVLANAAAGRWPEARRLREEILATSTRGRSYGGDRSLAALTFGDRTAALDALEQEIAALDLRNNPGCHPFYESLRQEPRFMRLMRKHGIAVCAGRARWAMPEPPR